MTSQWMTRRRTAVNVRIFILPFAIAIGLVEPAFANRPLSRLQAAALDCGNLQCRTLAVDSMDSRHLVVASDRGIDLSTDSGVTWTSAPLAGDFEFAGFDPFRPDVVFASTADRFLYRSQDGGRNWDFVANAPVAAINDIAFSPLQPE